MATFDDTFRGWAEAEIARALAARPGKPRFAFDDLDGCTFGRDVCPDCCVLHDIAYRVGDTATDRALADRELRLCIAGKARHEDLLWRWTWPALAWSWWVLVRLFGRFPYRKHRRAEARQET